MEEKEIAEKNVRDRKMKARRKVDQSCRAFKLLMGDLQKEALSQGIRPDETRVKNQTASKLSSEPSCDNSYSTTTCSKTAEINSESGQNNTNRLKKPDLIGARASKTVQIQNVNSSRNANTELIRHDSQFSRVGDTKNKTDFDTKLKYSWDNSDLTTTYSRNTEFNSERGQNNRNRFNNPDGTSERTLKAAQIQNVNSSRSANTGLRRDDCGFNKLSDAKNPTAFVNKVSSWDNSDSTTACSKNAQLNFEHGQGNTNRLKNSYHSSARTLEVQNVNPELNRHNSRFSEDSTRNEQNKTIHSSQFTEKYFHRENACRYESKEYNPHLSRSKSFGRDDEGYINGTEKFNSRNRDFNRSKSHNFATKNESNFYPSSKGFINQPINEYSNPRTSTQHNERKVESSLLSSANNELNSKIDTQGKLSNCHLKNEQKYYTPRNTREDSDCNLNAESDEKNMHNVEKLNKRNRGLFGSESLNYKLKNQSSHTKDSLRQNKDDTNLSPRKFNHRFESDDEPTILSSVKDKTNLCGDEIEICRSLPKKVFKNNSKNCFNGDFRIQPGDVQRTPKRSITMKSNDSISVSVFTNSPQISDVEVLNSSDKGDSFMQYLANKNEPITNVSTDAKNQPCKSNFQKIESLCTLDNISSFEKNESFELGIQKEDTFCIPPPHPKNYVDNACSPGQTSGYISTGETEILEAHSCSKRINEITTYLKEIEQEQCKTSALADQVLNDINKVVRYHFKGDKVILYGSYLSDLAVTSSNINLAVESNQPPKTSYLADLRKFMYNKMEDTKNEGCHYYIEAFEPESNPKRSKIYFSDSEFGIQCEVVYAGKTVQKYIKMNCLLKELCDFDDRVKTLIVAARFFAEESSLHDAKYGRLHVMSFSLMVVYFLQQLKPPVLPIVKMSSDEAVLKEISRSNSTSLGELWLEFLKFYSQQFDWDNDVICITSLSKVTKREKSWTKQLIAIEDPFTGKNIAESVLSSEVAEHVRYCFKNFYEDSLSPASDTNSDSSENETEIKASQSKYSFNYCKQLKVNLPSCEECDELGGPCGGCYKLVPSEEKIPEINRDSLKYVKAVLNDVVKKNVLSEGNIKGRQAFVRVLEKFIQKKYGLANLSLYGSSVNGFGFASSDLDICMSFRKKMKVGDVQILRGVTSYLRRDSTYEDVYGIYYANIPLVRFSSVPSLGWKCEITLSNALAVHNSKLLNTYAEFDERCKILGCALKLLAKKSGIADCVTKSLSSYSYIIMTIHYLQQIDPPVLPVFPILHFKEFEHNAILPDNVMKHNHWLNEDASQLRERYSYACNNKTDIAELWLGLLDFYLNYDFDLAITIIQKEPLSASELKRHARLFNIQDPFLREKNLGCAVSDRKAQEIMRIFHRARVLFGKEKPSSVTDLKSHYFSTMNLTGKYTRDLDCTLCGAYGHDIRECKKSKQRRPNGNFYSTHRNKL